MSNVMNISSLMLSKPGGGASAQSHMMGVPMLIPFAHSLWEGGNQHELEKANLALSYDADTPLSQQIEEAVGKQKWFAPTPMPAWQENLVRYLTLRNYGKSSETAYKG